MIISAVMGSGIFTLQFRSSASPDQIGRQKDHRSLEARAWIPLRTAIAEG
jgi:hypothetical protein